jgi:hypothetical protein
MTVYQSFVLHLCLSVYKSFVLHLGVSAYKSSVYAIPEEYSFQIFFSLFRFFSKQVCLFRFFQYVFETPKQTEKEIFWFHETNRKTTETDCVSVLFGSNRKYFFVCFEDTISRAT